MKSFYIWPLKYYNDSRNPYLMNLEDSLKKYFESNNSKAKNKKWRGVFGLFFNLDADIIIINWPENIVFKKNGVFQVFFYVLFLFLSKLFFVDIVWIFHNKKAHKKHFLNEVNSILLFLTAKFSKITIVHAKSGVEYYKNKFKRNNVFFLEHPVYGFSHQKEKNEKKWDFIIWGKIEPYKNILEFLQYFTTAPEFINSKVLICGSCTDIGYKEGLMNLIDERIDFINEHLSDNNILDYIYQSNTILFTYNSSSIFCSGSCIFSLETKKDIVGPNSGYFSELATEKLIGVFNSFSEIYEVSKNLDISKKKIADYIEHNTWERFAVKFCDLLKK